MVPEKCIANAQKPLFFSSVNPFYELDLQARNLRGMRYDSAHHLQDNMSTQKILLEGNARHLSAHLSKQLGKQNVKIAYFGSHYLQDIACTNKLNEELAKDLRLETWDPIGVVPEFS